MAIPLNHRDYIKMSPSNGKTILVDVEVIDAPLDYNILLGRSYMYAMQAVDSSVFCMILFPHNGKITTVDQMTYYYPKSHLNPNNVLPTIEGSQPISSLTGIGPRVFKDSTLLRTYYGPPLVVSIPSTSNMCMVISSQKLVDPVPTSIGASSSQPSGMPTAPVSSIPSWGGVPVLGSPSSQIPFYLI